EALVDLRATISAAAGITRTGEELAAAIARLRARPSSPAHLEAPFARHELANMTLVASLILQAAFLRTESRGSHYRADYPGTDPSWERRLYFSRDHEVRMEGIA
ncbi:MAG: L-aspartate oxidase, partial [Bacteroidota bacterium]